MLRESDLAQVRDWCERVIPADAGTRARVECEDSEDCVTLVERRAPWTGVQGGAWSRREIARLRYSQHSGTWTVEWDDGSRWRAYTRRPPSSLVIELLREIERDRCGVFWSSPPGSGGEERRRDVALA